MAKKITNGKKVIYIATFLTGKTRTRNGKKIVRNGSPISYGTYVGLGSFFRGKLLWFNFFLTFKDLNFYPYTLIHYIRQHVIDSLFFCTDFLKGQCWILCHSLLQR